MPARRHALSLCLARVQPVFSDASDPPHRRLPARRRVEFGSAPRRQPEEHPAARPRNSQEHFRVVLPAATQKHLQRHVRGAPRSASRGHSLGHIQGTSLGEAPPGGEATALLDQPHSVKEPRSGIGSRRCPPAPESRAQGRQTARQGWRHPEPGPAMVVAPSQPGQFRLLSLQQAQDLWPVTIPGLHPLACPHPRGCRRSCPYPRAAITPAHPR